MELNDILIPDLNLPGISRYDLLTKLNVNETKLNVSTGYLNLSKSVEKALNAANQ
jgi:hypothetical protein